MRQSACQSVLARYPILKSRLALSAKIFAIIVIFASLISSSAMLVTRRSRVKKTTEDQPLQPDGFDKILAIRSLAKATGTKRPTCPRRTDEIDLRVRDRGLSLVV